MSLNLSVCKLDLKQFRATLGSRDRALLARTLREHQAYIAQQDSFYQARFLRAQAPQMHSPTGYLSLADAIAQVIEGRIDPAARPRFQYEHAAALLADTLGEPLDPGPLHGGAPLLWSATDLFLQARARRAGLPATALPTLESLLTRGPALDLPCDPLEPLGTGYLTEIETRAAQKTVSQLDLSPEDEPDEMSLSEEAAEAARAYARWLHQAAADGLGLFFHA